MAAEFKSKEFACKKDICIFANKNDIKVVSITKSTWCFTLFYYENKDI
jgi:hypothetical protein